MAAAAILSFIFSWNNFIFALILTAPNAVHCPWPSFSTLSPVMKSTGVVCLPLLP